MNVDTDGRFLTCARHRYAKTATAAALWVYAEMEEHSLLSHLATGAGSDWLREGWQCLIHKATGLSLIQMTHRCQSRSGVNLVIHTKGIDPEHCLDIGCQNFSHNAIKCTHEAEGVRHLQLQFQGSAVLATPEAKLLDSLVYQR